MTKHFASRYPRSGQKAILCEGDLIGYEADLLESWTGEHPELGLVDVWPCGTKTAIFGMSDAIGRAVSVLVIEDRDHRTIETADTNCRRNKEDRISRGVRISNWKTWQRSEIENYLLEPMIVLPVFSEVFETDEKTVSLHLQDLLKTTACDQSLQKTLSEFRSAFPNGEREVGGVNRTSGRPRWSEEGLVFPKLETVESLLRKVLEDANKRLAPERVPDIDDFMSRFGKQCQEWSNFSVDDEKWRVDWAGKELLGLLRQRLAGEFGWPDKKDPSARVKIKWESLTRKEFGEWDRRIERIFQKRLVKRFLTMLKSGSDLSKSIVEEWNGIIAELKKM